MFRRRSLSRVCMGDWMGVGDRRGGQTMSEPRGRDHLTFRLIVRN